MTQLEQQMIDELVVAQGFTNDLAANLITQGVAASYTEGLDTLVPKVLQIESGEGINAFLQVDYFSQTAPTVYDPSGGETWISYDGKIYVYDMSTSQWVFDSFADENTVYIADAAQPIGIKRRYSVIFRNGTYILLSMVDLYSISHNDILNRNGNPDFLHTTQAQQERWTKNFSYKIEDTSVSIWAASTAYAGYGFQAQIDIDDLSEFDSVNVVFGLLDAISGNYAPAIEIYEGYILVFSKVNTTITIPTIEITKIEL